MLRRWTDVWEDFDRTFAWMDTFRRQMDHSFEEPVRGVDLRSSRGFPSVNLYDRGDQFVIKADLPGLTEKDLNVIVNQDVLTISGTRESDVPEGYTAHRRERIPLRFSRSFSFPSAVDTEQVAASVKNGVLTVRLAKAAEAQPRQIAVKAE